jgi:hypothetical protein
MQRKLVYQNVVDFAVPLSCKSLQNKLPPQRMYFQPDAEPAPGWMSREWVVQAATRSESFSPR